MVRFSDMLGGSGEAEDQRAANSPYAELAAELSDRGTDDIDADVDEVIEPGADVDVDVDEAPEPEADSEADREPPELEASPGPEPEPEVATEAVTDFESPEAVLERLTRYASSARAADQSPPTSDSDAAAATDAGDDPDPADPLSPVGDDFLPHPKGIAPRPGWGRKRRP